MTTKAVFLLMFFCGSVCGGLGFIMGNFVSNYGNDLCYSALVTQLSDKALKVAGSNDALEIEAFQQLIESLPNHGRESSCNEMQQKLSRT